MFKIIRKIDDVRPAVEGKTEIRFQEQPNGVTVGCYMFMDSKTFDSPEALECRGIAFGKDGSIVSRPLHKFFNMGEKDWLAPERVIGRDDIAAIYDKLDGSMIATAWVDGKLHWRSKKSFGSDVVKLTQDFLADLANEHILDFADAVASNGMTAIFELTHPQARIVVSQEKAALRLLHVRDNVTGEYVLLNIDHPIYVLLEKYRPPQVRSFDLSMAGAVESLETMREQEGYVVQFKNGDMMKVKCPWYLRLHHSVTFLRERDIALAALNEELDDIKGALAEVGIDLAKVEDVEARVKKILAGIMDSVEAMYAAGRDMDRKSFALANKDKPLFGLAMSRYLGKEVPLIDWYTKHQLKDDFSLRVVDDTVAAEFDG